MNYLNKIGNNATKSFKSLNKVSEKEINNVLRDFNKKLILNTKQIIKENFKDIKNAKRKNLIDRLVLNKKKIEEIRHSINEIIKFKTPLGKTLAEWKRPNGLKIKRISTSIGVIGVIYESRPNVTADVASLCLKSGNCSILRGGTDAYNSNKIIANLFRDSLSKNRFDKNCVQFIEKKERKIVELMLSSMTKFIDVIVPRGGKGLVSKVQKYSRVPVIGHLEGVCHIYVDKKSNLNMAQKIIINSKLRRTSICGAVETLLINAKVLKNYGVPIIKNLVSRGCEVIVDKKINKLFNNKLKFAKESDWKKEYLDAKISIKSVSSVNEAIFHIQKYGTMHTDSIITSDNKVAQKFLNEVNSSIAMHNTSTQFADGGELGFGGEIGISTNKLPPRGPVGLNQLTSYKYVVLGKGTIRS
ncbi:glutamate-5-semialdehyde dehydrogenase [Pelagibacteraceae bacterium]|nr:glutamate-5-semialdehyde dehydrogenase [Pelagibacteraceae bacterium]